MLYKEPKKISLQLIKEKAHINVQKDAFINRKAVP